MFRPVGLEPATFVWSRDAPEDPTVRRQALQPPVQRVNATQPHRPWLPHTVAFAAAALLVSIAGCAPGSSGSTRLALNLFATSQPAETAPADATADGAEPPAPRTRNTVPLPPPPPPGTAAQSNNDETLIVLMQVQFVIQKVRAPAGFFSRSGKIWNHLELEAIPAATAALLDLNGMRVARGRPDAWAPIEAMFQQQEDLYSSTSNMMMIGGVPLAIELDQAPRDQTLFLFRPDRTLAGVDIPGSTNFIRIEYGVPLEQPDNLMVEVMPEFRLRETRPTPFVFGPAARPTRPQRILRELAFRMEIPPEHFFVIGPSLAAHNGNLAGSLLLCDRIEGRLYESMYFITPRLIRTTHSRTVQ